MCLPNLGYPLNSRRISTTPGGLTTLCPKRCRPRQKGPLGWSPTVWTESSLPMYACTWVCERTLTPYLHQGVGEDAWGLWNKGRRNGERSLWSHREGVSHWHIWMGMKSQNYKLASRQKKKKVVPSHVKSVDCAVWPLSVPSRSTLCPPVPAGA